MDWSTPGLPVHHQLPECIQTHVHWVHDAIQPSHPLSYPSPPAFNLSQHQGLFKWVSSSNQETKVNVEFIPPQSPASGLIRNRGWETVAEKSLHLPTKSPTLSSATFVTTKEVSLLPLNQGKMPHVHTGHASLWPPRGVALLIHQQPVSASHPQHHHHGLPINDG